MLTVESFNENNREKKIGNSLYRICQCQDTGKWYISELYNGKNVFSKSRYFYSDSLRDVIDKFNSISKERVVFSNYIREKVEKL